MIYTSSASKNPANKVILWDVKFYVTFVCCLSRNRQSCAPSFVMQKKMGRDRIDFYFKVCKAMEMC